MSDSVSREVSAANEELPKLCEGYGTKVYETDEANSEADASTVETDFHEDNIVLANGCAQTSVFDDCPNIGTLSQFTPLEIAGLDCSLDLSVVEGIVEVMPDGSASSVLDCTWQRYLQDPERVFGYINIDMPSSCSCVQFCEWHDYKSNARFPHVTKIGLVCTVVTRYSDETTLDNDSTAPKHEANGSLILSQHSSFVPLPREKGRVTAAIDNHKTDLTAQEAQFGGYADGTVTIDRDTVDALEMQMLSETMSNAPYGKVSASTGTDDFATGPSSTKVHNLQSYVSELRGDIGNVQKKIQEFEGRVCIVEASRKSRAVSGAVQSS